MNQSCPLGSGYQYIMRIENGCVKAFCDRDGCFRVAIPWMQIYARRMIFCENESCIFGYVIGTKNN